MTGSLSFDGDRWNAELVPLRVDETGGEENAPYIPSSVIPSEPFMTRNVPHSWTVNLEGALAIASSLQLREY